MWKAQAGLQINTAPAEDDDWETDPDFVNDVSEEEQRWGSKTIEGSGRTAGAIDMGKLRLETEQADQDQKKKQLKEQNPGYGYGGKFGVQTDRMDKSAMGHDYQGKVEKHGSQKDYSDGFGGKFGIQKDRVDKSAAGWDHIEKVEKHASQKDYSDGFGGKYGIQKDRVDKSAVGWDHVEKVEKHESQKDYSKGFGGKFGIQEDRKDKSAVGWDHIEAPQKHESQVDHKVGFGGKFGVQKDRMDKSAAGYDDSGKQQVGTSYTKVKPNIEGAKPSNLRAKFENLAKNTEEETRKRSEEQKRLREAKDRRDRDEAAKKTIVENTPLPAADEARAPPPKGSRSIIATGREGGIGNAISAFNQMQSPTTETPPARKDPIAIPKQPKIEQSESVEEVQKKQQQIVESPNVAAKEIEVKQTSKPPPPDVIPSIEIQHVATPPEELSPTQNEPPAVEEQDPVYQNQADIAEQKQQQQQPVSVIQKSAQPKLDEAVTASAITSAGTSFATSPGAASVAPPAGFGSPLAGIGSPLAAVGSPSGAISGGDEAIYANSENLADYIEDTGLHAIALYDYQAADDDEISFDPDDTITHIEMIDEGWWRGLSKNRYGLFPANYVQLVNHQQT